MLIDVDLSCLLVVDIQSRLASAIHGCERVIANSGILMRAAARLGVPVLVSEQYPKGLGATVAELDPVMPAGGVLEKVHFSCMADADYAERMHGNGRGQAVVAGIEAHVCVLQTCMELLDEGYAVFVVADATSSRTPENATAALDRLACAGAQVVSTEMVVFEWLRLAGTPEFKELSALIK